MSSLKEKINSDLKIAMKNKKTDTISALRMFMAAIKEKEIVLRKGKDVELNDDQVVEVLMSEIKKRRESISDYEKGKREDLVLKEKNEIKVLEKYLPKQLGDDELERIVREIKDSIGKVDIKDFGRVIGQVMPKVKGKASGNRVSEAVKKILS